MLFALELGEAGVDMAERPFVMLCYVTYLGSLAMCPRQRPRGALGILGTLGGCRVIVRIG